ncbi:MAG: DUF5320 domain-containing protein [Acidobacteria bacterium]|nr:DUF5320 domain-containing protein [Acidobacteriota bacterium]
MPRGDRTGPAGAGPMTGRAMGLCAGYDTPGFMNLIPGRGIGMRGGRGMQAGGRGWRNRFYATGVPMSSYGSMNVPVPVDEKQEVEILKNHAVVLQQQLDAINKRMEDLTEPKE